MKLLKKFLLALFGIAAIVFGLLLLLQEDKNSRYVSIYDET